MLEPRIEECLEKVGGKYALSAVAAKRMKDLAAHPGVDYGAGHKELTYTLKEIADGKISPCVGSH